MKPHDLKTHIHITDVGPRDGLQNESTPISSEIKIALVEKLAAAGVLNVESASFVSPKWVPQMADGAAVLSGVLSGVLASNKRNPAVTYSALTPNMRGFEAALAAGAQEIVIFAAASEAFSQKNTNCSIAESIERFRPVVKEAFAAGVQVRAAVSVAFGCPYQGDVSVQDVVDVARRIDDLGLNTNSGTIGIADTIGTGIPTLTTDIYEAVAKHIPMARLAGHFHDTYGMALANTVAALNVGVTRYESSVGGLGGCPYAKGATGNVATEDLVYLLHRMGYDTGIDLDQLIDIGAWISQIINKPYLSRVGKALLTKRAVVQ